MMLDFIRFCLPLKPTGLTLPAAARVCGPRSLVRQSDQTKGVPSFFLVRPFAKSASPLFFCDTVIGDDSLRGRRKLRGEVTV